MAVYRKKNLSNYKGRYHRMIGKVRAGGGELKSRRFLLGTDERAAELAVRRLEQLWSEIEADFRRRQSHARIINLRDRYSVIAFVPSDPELYAEQLRAMSGRVETGLRKAEMQAQRTKRFTDAAVRTKGGQTLYAAIDAYAA